MAWLDETDLNNLATAARLVQWADDDANATADPDVITAALVYAKANVKSYLQQVYPSQCTAETESETVTAACGWFALDFLASRKPPTHGLYRSQVEKFEALLAAINSGSRVVPEWHSTPTVSQVVAQVQPINESDQIDLVGSDGTFDAIDYTAAS